MADDGAYRQPWDLFVDGRPADTMDVLLGSLGLAGKPYDQQSQGVRAWLEAPSAGEAPGKLLERARRFISAGE